MYVFQPLLYCAAIRIHAALHYGFSSLLHNGRLARSAQNMAAACVFPFPAKNFRCASKNGEDKNAVASACDSAALTARYSSLRAPQGKARCLPAATHCLQCYSGFRRYTLTFYVHLLRDSLRSWQQLVVGDDAGDEAHGERLGGGGPEAVVQHGGGGGCSHQPLKMHRAAGEPLVG